MTVHYLADGDAGAEQSIDDMRGIVDKALKSPQVYVLARQIVQHVPAYDEDGELRALYDWVLRNIRFVKGVIGKQSLQTVDATLAMQTGQCTDLSTLMAALAMSIGYPVHFMAAATDPAAPDQFSHIYPEAQLRGEWIPMDAARENAAFGVPPSRLYRSQAFSILDSVGNMPRLGSTADDIASAITAAGQSAAEIIQAQNSPYLLAANGQYVVNPNYSGSTQPLLQASSQALGIPSLILLGLGAWLLYTVLKR